MKILVSAYSCETGRGSEGEIGWRLVSRLAEDNDVWVITRANLRGVHQKAFLETGKPPRLRFVYFDLPWVLRFYKKGGRFFLVYYYLWQIGIAVTGWRLARKHKFDVLHHLIGGMDWMPSGLALVPGKFVWGPVGSESTHPRMRSYLSPTSRVKDHLRVVARWWMRHLDPFVRFTGWRAGLVLTHTIETMPRRYAHKMHALSQTGIENSLSLAKQKVCLERPGPMRILFAGELKDWKGACLALHAALKFFETESAATLRIVGDGPLRRSMEAIALADRHGDRVKFLGRLSMNELTSELHQSDVFIYPSFHHGLATIVLQAMLTGLPVVCVEGDATARAVGSRAGISVALSDNIDPAEALAAALTRLSNDEVERCRLAEAAREIALSEYSYDSLAKDLSTRLKEFSNVDRAQSSIREY